MNEHTLPPKLENIAAAIKFRTVPGENGHTQLVASLNVGSSCWFSEYEAQKHPDVMAILKEKLKQHLLRQLYHNQIAEIQDAVADLLISAGPFPRSLEDAMKSQERLMKLVRHSPPLEFDDGECERGPNCGCEQFKFLLTSRTK